MYLNLLLNGNPILEFIDRINNALLALDARARILGTAVAGIALLLSLLLIAAIFIWSLIKAHKDNVPFKEVAKSGLGVFGLMFAGAVTLASAFALIGSVLIWQGAITRFLCWFSGGGPGCGG